MKRKAAWAYHAEIQGVVALRPVATEKALTGSFRGTPGYASFWGPGIREKQDELV